jgi:peptide/nickel transport system ATP-binding protein
MSAPSPIRPAPVARTEVHHTLVAENVDKDFVVHQGGGRTAVAQVLRDTSITLQSGRITGVVGESGSGKSTLARILAGFDSATSGRLLLDGQEVKITGRRSRKRFGAQVQMIFQDPFAALNNQRPVRHNLERALRIHGLATSRKDAEPKIIELLERVRLFPGAEFIDKLPHELSGGQRQRVSIARALAVNPIVLLGDEPISMLDVSMRLDVLNLLDDLRTEGLAMLYITHDLASARYLCDDLAVMYGGRLVEFGPADDVISNPSHPYTRLLVHASPDPARAIAAEQDVAWSRGSGEPPSPLKPPEGCPYHPRCPLATAICATRPPRVQVSHEHWSDCWHVDELQGSPGIG